ncbi:MAG: GreA/GreB family elongation factor [Bacteriovorax sp.]|nr:GreA/GreB family elongation factor [Bacteriovorax sp.]
MFDKKIVLDSLLENLRRELAEVEAAAHSAKDLATQDDLKSEGKYDTRAIEASYLASAQLKRVEEIKIDIQMLEELELQPSQQLQMGSLALIEFNAQKRYYFLTSTSGGTMLTINGENVLVISVFSPLGSEALGAKKGESFEVETPKETRVYKVLDVY